MTNYTERQHHSEGGGAKEGVGATDLVDATVSARILGTDRITRRLNEAIAA